MAASAPDLTRRLAAHGHHIPVAGRNLDRANAFCSGLANAEPVVADRNRPLDDLRRDHRPDIVIDAAGPFQGSGYEVPLACARASIHYLDLADARDFVTGIAALDQLARDGGVAISASNATSASASVAAAILSYVGRPVRRWRQGWGWQNIHRHTFAAGGVSLRGRWVALAEVPDLDLMPDMLP